MKNKLIALLFVLCGCPEHEYQSSAPDCRDTVIAIPASGEKVSCEHAEQMMSVVKVDGREFLQCTCRRYARI